MGKRGGTKGTISLEAYLRRRPRRIWATTILVIAGLTLAVFVDRWMGKPAAYESRRWHVHAVTGANKLQVLSGNTKIELRLLGIRVPPHADEEARRAIESLALNQTVRLRVPGQPLQDDDHCIPAFVELQDGSTLNERLILSGLAEATDEPRHLHQEKFALLEEQSRKSGLGIWKR